MVSSSPRSYQHKQSRLPRDKAAPFLIGAAVGLIVLTIMSSSSSSSSSSSPTAPAAATQQLTASSSSASWADTLSSYFFSKGTQGEGEWYTKPLPPLKHRVDIGAMLDEEGRWVGGWLSWGGT